MPDETGRRKGRRRLLGGALAIGVVAVVFLFFLPQIADYRDVWAVLKEMSWQGALAALAATALNVATFPPPWMVALPGLGYRQAFVMTQASTALSIVSPAGAAVGMAGSYTMLRSWGFAAGPVGLAVAVTGIWNQLANFAFPIVGLALLTSIDEGHPALRTAAIAGVVAFTVVVVGFALALSSEKRASRIGGLAARLVQWFYRVLRRRKVVSWGGDALARFRSRTLDLLRRRWHILTVTTLVGHLAVFVVLLVCLRAIGITESEVSWIEAFAAWSLVRILGALPLTPGGLGFVELGLTGALVAFGASNADAVAATLLYRALTIFPTLALGMLGGATWRTHHPGQRLEGGADNP